MTDREELDWPSAPESGDPVVHDPYVDVRTIIEILVVGALSFILIFGVLIYVIHEVIRP